MTICAIIPYETCTNPSTEVLASYKIFVLIYLIELPLQNLLALVTLVSFLFFIEVEKGVAMSVSTDIILV